MSPRCPRSPPPEARSPPSARSPTTRARRGPPPGRPPRTTAPVATERLGALQALVRLGHDMLIAEAEAPAAQFPGWLVATVSGGETEQRSRDAVDVASFHASKGLEWRVVHLAGLEEGYVP